MSLRLKMCVKAMELFQNILIRYSFQQRESSDITIRLNLFRQLNILGSSQEFENRSLTSKTHQRLSGRHRF